MIGLGVDLCAISRIEQELERGDGFLRRYYAEEERAYLDARGKTRAQSAAAMFAAKEAALKAMGCGLSGGVALAEIVVVHDALGCPGYRLTGAALEKLRQLGGARAFLSLTHEGDSAVAVCVLE